MTSPIDALVVTGTYAYPRLSDESKRAVAVGAALDLIRAQASAVHSPGTLLDVEMNNLSRYADLIQEALKG